MNSEPPKLASLDAHQADHLAGDITTVIYLDGDGTVRQFHARDDDPNFIAWQRERASGTTVEVGETSLSETMTVRHEGATEPKSRHERRAAAAQARRR